MKSLPEKCLGKRREATQSTIKDALDITIVSSNQYGSSMTIHCQHIAIRQVHTSLSSQYENRNCCKYFVDEGGFCDAERFVVFDRLTRFNVPHLPAAEATVEVGQAEYIGIDASQAFESEHCLPGHNRCPECEGKCHIPLP